MASTTRTLLLRTRQRRIDLSEFVGVLSNLSILRVMTAIDEALSSLQSN